MAAHLMEPVNPLRFAWGAGTRREAASDGAALIAPPAGPWNECALMQATSRSRWEYWNVYT